MKKHNIVGLVFLVILSAGSVLLGVYLAIRGRVGKDPVQQEDLFHTVAFYGGNEGELTAEYQVRHGELFLASPVAKRNDALFCGWRNVTVGGERKEDMPILEDVVFEASWREIRLLSLNGLAFAGMEASEVNLEELERLLQELTEQREQGN